MKKFFISAISVFTLFLVAGSQYSCNSQNTQSAQSCNISATDFAKKDLGDAVIIDVRTPGEYTSGHLKNAELIDFSSSDFASKIAQLDKSAQYYVYCKAGSRSSRAMGYMVQNGFSNVCNIQGGISALSGAGVPLVK